MNLQSFIIPPRACKDPRIAKTDGTKLMEGDDGFLYKMLDKRDQGIYRILSAREEQEELNRSREIKENMYTMTGKFKDGQYTKGNSLSKSGLKFVPPQFGTTSHKSKIDKREWEQDMKAGMAPGGGGKANLKSAKFNSTIMELTRNSAPVEPVEEELEEDSYAEHPYIHHPTQDEFNSRAGGGGSLNNSQIFDTINTMKTKYEQNLTVVEKLYNEKKAMENKIKSLESILHSTVGLPTDQFDYDRYDHTGHQTQSANRQDDDERHYRQSHNNSTDTPPPPYSEFQQSSSRRQAPMQSTQQQRRPQSAQPSRPQSANTRGGMAAAEAANHFSGTSSRGIKQSEYEPTPRPASARPPMPPRHTQSVDQGRPSRSHSAPRGGRDRQSAGGVGQSLDSTGRSVSATRRSTSGISQQLQADADRYVQRRRAIEEQEKMDRLAEEQYQHAQKERLLKASLTGKLFTDMFRRQEEAALNQQRKLEQKEKLEIEAKKKREEERKEAFKAKQEFMTSAVKNTMSWKELQESEESKRRERIEKRKQELQLLNAGPPIGNMSSAPGSASGSRKNSTHADLAASTHFKAEDPAKVAERLAKLRRQREQQDLVEKEKKKEKLKLAATEKIAQPKSAMEIRQEEYEAKMAKRAADKKIKEDEEKEAKLAEEKRKRDILLNMKVPEGKITKSVELKAEKIKQDVERQQAEERKHLAMMRKKELSMKETAAAVRVIIAERENERRGSSGTHHIELSSNQVDAVAAARAAAAREEFREKLRANKQKLQDSLKNRPSLLDRHDKKIATKTASLNALRKVADAVMSATTGHDSGGGHSGRRSAGGKDRASQAVEDDLFDPKEKMLLGMDD